MNIISNIRKFKRYNIHNVHNLNYVKEKNLNDLIEILSTSIDDENKSQLINLVNNWNYYHYHISIWAENDRNYIINNSNQLNHINSLIEEAKYIISISSNKE